ncbi:DotG/IcmE/VirB10 family protein [Pseudomonas sp. W22_MBD1_FP4]|uniref:DotG/IcmE/VirB10 family protein n=1 Tax=Pseudomonas sp. W22_MBD1_FP4 TaxID=3240272 RepID=UPI003F9DD0AF
MNKEINDLDLENIGGADGDRISSRGTVEIPGTGGASAVKSIFSPRNRVRLLFIGVAVAAMLSACVWAFVSTTASDAKAVGGGVTDGGNIVTSRTGKPSNLQREEADRFNNQQLQHEQETDPSAHPIILTEDEDNNPFVEQRGFRNPDRISKAGNQTNDSSGQPESAPAKGKNVTIVYPKGTQELVTRILQNETEEPQLDSQSWSYATVKSNTTKNLTSSTGRNEVTDYDSKINMNGELANKCKNPVVRAGRQYMARSTMAYSSDVGGPLIVEVINGPLRLHRLKGEAVRKEEWNRISFTTLFGKDDPRKIDAIGLDTETALNAVGGDVDYHTLYRYGWWGVGATLAALGKAAQANSNTDTVFVGDNVVQNTTRDTSRELKMAVGDLGESIGDVFKSRIDRPVTVSLKVNDTIGIVFMDDVCGDK